MLFNIVLKRHSMMTSLNGNIFALLAFCAENSPVTGEFPAQRPVTQSFDVFFDLRQNKRLSEQLWGGLFETPSRPLWRHFNAPLARDPFVLKTPNVQYKTSSLNIAFVFLQRIHDMHPMCILYTTPALLSCYKWYCWTSRRIIWKSIIWTYQL